MGLPFGRATKAATAQRGGLRIAVTGNCQARGIARSLELLLPDARVALVPAARFGRDRRKWAERAREFDIVFEQAVGTAASGASGSSEGASNGSTKLRFYPPVVFGAFHPDQIYVHSPGATGHTELVPSPLHRYHSAIVLFGHLRGLSAERILRLFHPETFEALGYFSAWAPSAQDLSASSGSIGFDLGLELTRWSRRGVFMHGINHPKLFVLADIAARLAREAGLGPAEIVVDTLMPDDLLDDVIWPVYPGIADVYGQAGSYAFKRRRTAGAAPAMLDLGGLVAESLAIYRALPRERLTSHRSEVWDGTPEIRALFDRA